jgi:peptidoglycan/LPS O-acetylase OafA/YrhL
VISQQMGRVLSAMGAVILVLALFLTWYHIDRTQGATDTTGWQTFTRLRLFVLAGAFALLVSALVPQGRGVLVTRTLLGLALGALILRRIIEPPNVDAPIAAQFGVAVGFVGAIAAAIGGLVDSGREVVAHHPGLGFGNAPGGLLNAGEDGEGARLRRRVPGPPTHQRRGYVDSTAEDL